MNIINSPDFEVFKKIELKLFDIHFDEMPKASSIEIKINSDDSSIEEEYFIKYNSLTKS